MFGPIWKSETEIKRREKLSENIKTQVAVIGAGLAGVLIADRLQNTGKQVVVLEARRIAGGQSGKTTAKITAQHGCVYAGFQKAFGAERARLYAKAQIKAVEWYRETVNSREIDCDFENTDACIYSLSDGKKLLNESEVCKALGLPVRFTLDTELPFKVGGAVFMENQGQFNPLKFIKAISKDIVVFENTPVRQVKGNILYCDGGRVEAEHIVFACHYPFPRFQGLYFTRIYQQRSYVIALDKAEIVKNMYIGIDGEGVSLRRYKNMLLLGGAGHRTGENRDGGKYDSLMSFAAGNFPKSRPVSYWSAQDCVTADGMAYIGRFSTCHPNWYIATGFGKWGMTNSALAADIITDLILDRENPYARLFSPTRFSSAAAKGIAGESVQAVKGLAKGNLSVPKGQLQGIGVGEGGIVNVDGKRVGVYRESEDKYHTVIPRCTHLGCGLEWNSDEKSWDCPCHGSRFDYMGNIIDNPAKKRLKKRGI